MRFFTKLYVGTLLILTFSLIFMGYLTIESSLTDGFEKAKQSGLQQHQLVKLAIHSDLVSSGKSTYNEELLKTITGKTSETYGVPVTILDSKNNEIYSALTANKDSFKTVDGKIKYIVRQINGKDYLVFSSNMDIGDKSVKFISYSRCDDIFENARNMRRQSFRIFVGALSAGALFTIAFSFLITRPIKELTNVEEEFMAGDYKARANLFPNDEIGDLSQSFNLMADSIEDKIGELELAIKQKEDFTSAFAHELKTPMTSIIGYADPIYQKEMPREEEKKAAEYILNEGMRLEALAFKLMKLINLSKSELVLEETEMTEFFDDVKATIMPLSEKRGIPVEFSAYEGYVKIERDLFKTMLMNLIDNAFKSGTDSVLVSGVHIGDKYTFSVEDKGRGIPADQVKRVTEAFYMVDKARSRQENGAGLGLSLCDKIAQVHGSHLDIESEEGVGTRISITLKAEEDEIDEED